MPSVNLTDAQRQTFAAIADLLVPEAEGMPSASQASVPDRYLDEAVGYRPDLADGLQEALRIVDGLDAQEAIELLNASHILAFETLGTLLAGAYFLNPDVRQLIGYPGQVPTPAHEDLDSYADLLENVIDRGQVYRDVGPVSV
jgi:hypothetical protein